MLPGNFVSEVDKLGNIVRKQMLFLNSWLGLCTSCTSVLVQYF